MATSIQPLRPNVSFTDKDGSLSHDAYEFLYALLRRSGGTTGYPVTASGGHLAGTATLTDVINKVNLIIDALVANGIMS